MGGEWGGANGRSEQLEDGRVVIDVGRQAQVGMYEIILLSCTLQIKHCR